MFNLSRNLNMPKVEEDKDVTAVEANVTTEETQVEAVENETPVEENVETTPAEETEEEVVVEDTAKESVNTSDIDHLIIEDDCLKFELYEGFAIESLVIDKLSKDDLEVAEEGRIADFFSNLLKSMRDKKDTNLNTNKHGVTFSDDSLEKVKKQIQKFDNVRGIEDFMRQFNTFSKKVSDAIIDMKTSCENFKTARNTFESSAKEAEDKKKFQDAIDRFKKEMNRAQKIIKIPYYIGFKRSILSKSSKNLTDKNALTYEINSETIQEFTSWVIEVDKMLKERHEELVKERESRLTTNAAKIAAKESLEEIKNKENEDMNSGIPTYESYIMNCMSIASESSLTKLVNLNERAKVENWVDHIKLDKMVKEIQQEKDEKGKVNDSKIRNAVEFALKLADSEEENDESTKTEKESHKTPSKKPLTKKEYLIAMTSEKVKNDPELKKLIVSGKMTREELVNMDIIKETDDVADKKKENEKATESVAATPAEEAVDPAVAFLGIYSGSVIGLLGIAAAIGAHKTKKKNKKAYAEISADLKTMLANIDAGIAEAEDYKEKNKSDKDAEKLADKVIKAYTSYRVFIASQLETLDTIKAMKKKEENNFEKYQDYLSIANEVINKSKKFMSDNAANIKELAKKTGVEDADKYLKDLIKSSKYAREYKRNNILVANESVAEEAKDNSDYNWKTNFNDGVKKVTEMIKAAQKSDNTNEKEDSLNHASREVGELKDKIENLDLETYKNIPGIKGDTEADLAEYKETKKSLIEKLEKEIDNMNNVATESYTKEEVTEFLKSFGLDENGNDIAIESATATEDCGAEEGKILDSIAGKIGSVKQTLKSNLDQLKKHLEEFKELKDINATAKANIAKKATNITKAGNKALSSKDQKEITEFNKEVVSMNSEIDGYLKKKATESLSDEDKECLSLLDEIDGLVADIAVESDTTESTEEVTDEDETVEEATESAAEEEAAYQSAIDELEEALLS